MIYKRYINLLSLLHKKSLLLLGPRQTGKSTLVKNLNAVPNNINTIYINLAESDTYRELSGRPELIRQRIDSNESIIIIDEAQRIPELFNETQIIIDNNPKKRVLLTGSSARKLKRTEINLLPGRIWKLRLFPLVYPELGSSRIKDRVMKGSLPGIIDSEDYKHELKNYVGLYLDEEVRSEGLVRKIGDFSRFLQVAGLSNAQQLNFSKISSDTGVKINTVRSFFEILEDTLIGSLLPSFRGTKSRKAVATPKFYFFDAGVVNGLLNQFDISETSSLFGNCLEHIIYLELVAYISYNQRDLNLSYWRTHSQIEVDFLIEEKVAIEVKASSRITSRDERGLQALKEDLKLERMIIVCNETNPRFTDSGVEVLPVEKFLASLWGNKIF